MKHLTRVNRLLNQVKRKYNIKDKINIKIIKKDLSNKRNRPYMEMFDYKIPFIKVFVNNFITRFEKLSDRYVKNMLSHELVHLLCFKYRKEKDSKVLKNVLRLINRMVDC